MRVTILGLGHMGRAAAIRLRDAGHEVTVWNRSPGKADDLVRSGVREGRTPVEASARADVVLTLLTNDRAVRSVVLGTSADAGSAAQASNLAGSLGPGAVLADMSTVYPATSRELGMALLDRFVDAPILGGPEAFQNRRAKLLVGGNDEVVRRLEPLWSDLSDTHFYTGPNGTATTLKLLSNLILVGGTALLAEAVVTAQRGGIDDDVLREVFGGSPAVAPGIRARLEDIVAGNHEGWWSLLLAEKDMGLVLRLAADTSVTLPLAARTEELVKESIGAGLGDLDLGAIVELIRRPT